MQLKEKRERKKQMNKIILGFVTFAVLWLSTHATGNAGGVPIPQAPTPVHLR
jgi:hypothetical protein